MPVKFDLERGEIRQRVGCLRREEVISTQMTLIERIYTDFFLPRSFPSAPIAEKLQRNYL
ncbi:hypothetical protein [Pinibacter aurantiacus]|uniref:hypothetical protein n=1 Tax=Pinibacter aurantiacus TaxID=2851599 RepID=UPI001C384A4C|nr:hypothetical protein [Pinibacter aurantiacus]